MNLAENANNAESNEQSGVNTGVKADGNGQEAEQESGNELIKNLPVFYAKDIKALDVKDDFHILSGVRESVLACSKKVEDVVKENQ